MVNNKNYNLLSALNTRTNLLLLSTIVSAPQFQTTKSSNMSAPNTSPQTTSAITAGRVTFQSTPNSRVNSTRSSNEGSTKPYLELSEEVVFEKNLFTKGYFTVLTGKDAVLKKVRNCVLEGEKQRCKDVNPYLHSFCRNLHWYCVCRRKGSNTQFYSRCSIGVPASNTSRKLGHDNSEPVFILAVYPSRDIE